MTKKSRSFMNDMFWFIVMVCFLCIFQTQACSSLTALNDFFNKPSQSTHSLWLGLFFSFFFFNVSKVISDLLLPSVDCKLSKRLCCGDKERLCIRALICAHRARWLLSERRQCWQINLLPPGRHLCPFHFTLNAYCISWILHHVMPTVLGCWIVITSL